ncbi:hypothetical protein TraAM80_07076 [Trypanosoma rangeli]|uniref:Uncharacterized protein n=1 Tax=Trypanosoma rangeli TaxID=5698 RepID=A0A3S5IQN5_TRYRA|nr:uncharacterized protein TraAM80_07076 [Trypanosoma rangeli]RNF01355.1 hypothetical protein TraAM80_07076 [Trypanosoma rangeli]|eukprot:RNF01355.1 hypothetical protein TraAM80_07076 [Trypanosoma rangeli]
MLANALSMERQSLRTASCITMNGVHTTLRNGTIRMGGVILRIVSVFGILFITAADAPICFAVDSCTCVSRGFQVNECGDITWELLEKVEGTRCPRRVLPTVPWGDRHGAEPRRFFFLPLSIIILVTGGRAGEAMEKGHRHPECHLVVLGMKLALVY